MKKINENTTLILAFLMPAIIMLIYFYAILHLNIPTTTFVEFLTTGNSLNILFLILFTISMALLMPLTAMLILRFAGTRDLTKPLEAKC